MMIPDTDNTTLMERSHLCFSIFAFITHSPTQKDCSDNEQKCTL